MKKVYYFTAAWCGPCRAFRPTLNEAISQTGANVTIIDVDLVPELAQQYSITSVPTTIVVDPSGAVVSRRSGVMSKAEIVSLLR